MRFLSSSAILCMAISMASVGYAACTPPLAKGNTIYLDNGNDTVTDNETGLMWQKCSQGLSDPLCGTGVVTTATWKDALAIAEASTLAGYTNWRLPNAKELASLTDKACANPAINSAIFPLTAPGVYWTSSPSAQFPDSAYSINFFDGALATDAKDTANHIRLVRGGY